MSDQLIIGDAGIQPEIRLPFSRGQEGMVLLDLPLAGDVGIVSAELFGAGGSIALAFELVGGLGIPTGEAFGAGGNCQYDQDVTGAAGIVSAEAFGAGVVTYLLTNTAGIPSAEAFSSKTGVWIEPATVPRGRFLAY